MILRKAGKLDVVQQITLGTYFYIILGLLFAGATVTNYDLSSTGAFWSFIGMFIGWPLAFDFMDFNQPDRGNVLKISIFVSSFIICQLIAVIMVLKRAKSDTDKIS